VKHVPVSRLTLALLAAWAAASLLQASVLAAQESMPFPIALAHAAIDESPLPLVGLALWVLSGLLERRPWPVVVAAHAAAAAVIITGWEAVKFLGLELHTGHAAAIYRYKGLWMLFNSVLEYGLLASGVVAVRATQRFERQQRRAAELALHAREAELRALRAQVRPHFLFNVLNSVYALVPARPAEAQEMIALLSDLMRRTLEAGDEALVPLEWELATTEAYLGIERIRLRERLRASIDVTGGGGEVLVPPLLLQPLVENAVKHGAAAAVEGGRVAVEARRANGTLELVVRNDCPPPEAAARADGRGLALTRARLDAVYGDAFSMEVQPQGSSFVVMLRLPATGA
jgi:LytS/YehU family sensor histidine kinase